MKIRAKSGEVYDLVSLRRMHNECKREDCLMQDLLDALEAACSVPEPEKIVVDNQWDTWYEKGFNDALAFIRKAAGVIEEGSP